MKFCREIESSMVKAKIFIFAFKNTSDILEKKIISHPFRDAMPIIKNNISWKNKQTQKR